MKTFVKGYEFLPFANNMWKNTAKNVGENISNKYSQTFLHRTNQSASDTFINASKKVIQKKVEAAATLNSNKVTDKITGTVRPKVLQKLLKKQIKILPNRTTKRNTYMKTIFYS